MNINEKQLHSPRAVLMNCSNLADKIQEIGSRIKEMQQLIASGSHTDQVAEMLADLATCLEDLHAERQIDRAITENVPFGLALIDTDGIFRYINPKFREMFGYDLEDIPCGREWFRKAYPDPGHRHEAISAWMKDLEGSSLGEKRPRIFTVTCKDETRKIIRFTAVLQEDGENLLSCEDITERMQIDEILRRTEAKYKVLVEQIPAITYTAALDDASTTLYISPQIEAALGFSPEEYRADPDLWRKRLHPDDRDRVLAELAQSLAKRQPFKSEYRMITRDGHVG